MKYALLVLCSVFAVGSADWFDKFRPIDDNAKIIGGHLAKPDQFPYQVSLQASRNGLFWRHYCGGSIIDEYHILTAAHCYFGLPSWLKLSVRAGKFHLTKEDNTEQVRFVDKVMIHEKYTKQGVAPFDIAVVRLKRPFHFNKFVQAVKLPEMDVLPTGYITISGWGSVTPKNFVIPDALRYAHLPLVSLEKCYEAMGALKEDSEEEIPLHPNNICTGPLTGGHTTCAGDSGGPLVQETKNGEHVIVGLVSWGIVPCGTVGAPAVHTRVSAYRDWIDEAMKK